MSETLKAQKFHNHISRTDEIIEDTKELTDEVVDRLIEEQRWKDADEADQILEQEALSHGFG